MAFDQKAYQKAYREANKEKSKAYQKAYREANKEKRKAYKKAYYKTHPDTRMHVFGTRYRMPSMKAKAAAQAWRDAKMQEFISGQKNRT